MLYFSPDHLLRPLHLLPDAACPLHTVCKLYPYSWHPCSLDSEEEMPTQELAPGIRLSVHTQSHRNIPKIFPSHAVAAVQLALKPSSFDFKDQSRSDVDIYFLLPSSASHTLTSRLKTFTGSLTCFGSILT